MYIRNYSSERERWIPGIVTKVLGTNTYAVHFGTGVRKMHADQMKERVIPWENMEDSRLERMGKVSGGAKDRHLEKVAQEKEGDGKV